MDFKKFWIYLDGKKTGLASAFWFISEAIVPIWFENGVPAVMDKIMLSIGITMTFLGLGHKTLKAGKK